jgi:flagellar motor switch protein FliN
MVAIKMDGIEDDDLFDDGAKSKRPGITSDNGEDEDIPHGEVDFLHDIPLSMKAQIGAVQRSVREILSMKSGAIIEFDKVVGEAMDVIVGGRLMCRGEIVVVNERYGIRISEVIRVEDSDKKLKPI